MNRTMSLTTDELRAVLMTSVAVIRDMQHYVPANTHESQTMPIVIIKTSYGTRNTITYKDLDPV